MFDLRVLVMALSFGGCAMNPPPEVVPNRGLAGVVWAVSLQGQETPDVIPPGPNGECDNCDGRGWIGDGQPRGDCPECETEWDNKVFADFPAEGGSPAGAPAAPSSGLINRKGGEISNPDKELAKQTAGAEKTVAVDASDALDCCQGQFEILKDFIAKEIARHNQQPPTAINANRQKNARPPPPEKLTLTVFYGENCPSCDAAEGDFLSVPELRDCLSKHYRVKRQLASGDQPRPSFQVGKEIAVGYFGPEKLLAWLKIQAKRKVDR